MPNQVCVCVQGKCSRRIDTLVKIFLSEKHELKEADARMARAKWLLLRLKLTKLNAKLKVLMNEFTKHRIEWLKTRDIEMTGGMREEEVGGLYAWTKKTNTGAPVFHNKEKKVFLAQYKVRQTSRFD